MVRNEFDTCIRRRIFIFCLPWVFLMSLIPFLIMMIYSSFGLIDTTIPLNYDSTRPWNFLLTILFQKWITLPFYYLITLLDKTHLFPRPIFVGLIIFSLLFVGVVGYTFSVGSFFIALRIFLINVLVLFFNIKFTREILIFPIIIFTYFIMSMRRKTGFLYVILVN
jgi:hypothetical protein